MNVPQLRFKGFNEEWESKKLNTMFDFYKGKGLSIQQLNGTKYPAIIYGELYTKYHEIINTVFSKSDSSGFLGYKNDLLFPGSSTVANGTAQTNALMVDNVQLGGDIIIARPKQNNVNSVFMSYQINSQKTKLYPIIVGTTITHMYGKDLSKLKFMITNLSEQQKIGTFFSKLDDLITKQTRKVMLLKQLKRGYLQKLFPQAGQTTPQLRFKGFNDEWQILKANKIFTSISDKNHNMLPVLSATQTKGMVYRDDVGINIKYNRKGLNNYKHVLPGNFVIHLRSFQSGFAYSDKEGIVSPAYTVMTFKNEDNDELFWKVRFTSSNFIKRLVTITYGIRDGRSINYKDFETLKFSVPLYEEQQKIGALFAKLDHLIELQNRKLELLEELKKGYLQKMFI